MILRLLRTLLSYILLGIVMVIIAIPCLIFILLPVKWRYDNKLFFWLSHFCRRKYNNVDLIFIAHDVYAKIVPEENFFTISNSGGTMCSSAFKLALQNIKENHPIDAVQSTSPIAFSADRLADKRINPPNV